LDGLKQSSQQQSLLAAKPGNSVPTSQSDAKVLTLQQVISLVDSRLTNLEKNLIEIKSQPDDNASVYQSTEPEVKIDSEYISNIVHSVIYEHLNEFNSRYELLAGEIADLKNIIIGVQSYTLSINKTLLEERIKVMSNISISTEDFSIVPDLCEAETEESVPVAQENLEEFTGLQSANNEPLAKESATIEDTASPEESTTIENNASPEESTKTPDESNDIAIITKSQKKGRGSNKRSQMTLEKE
jgi:hypothetical protein